MDQNNQTGAAATQATLLFVDDEANILSSLKRLFRPYGYRIFTAEGGAAGLEIMAQEPVDLVISDMRMPEMNGAQFLEQVRQNWPDAVRILLTGYADVGSTIDAINKGQIYRYISKPWEDNDITITVRQALERRMLEREKTRLEALAQQQNEQLKELNASLESKVQARTEELRQTMSFLEMAHEKLKKGFMASIRAFSSLIEMRGGGPMAGHAKRVGENVRRLAQRMGVAEGEAQDLMFAAMLKDLGKMSLPDYLLSKPLFTLDDREMALVTKHPIRGQAALMSLEQMEGAAKIIRHQHEHFNGNGYPDRLSGLEIPLGARILAVASDYDALQAGMLQPKHFSPAEAVSYLVVNRGKRYDPMVVDAFVELLKGMPTPVKEAELKLHTFQLKSGMTVARELVAKDGILLLMRGHVLDEKLIGMLRGYEKAMDDSLSVYIRAG
ncbi:MAG: response regulator [Gallionella sp.]|nr:MAG: response regulator [Gallionella sp.]